MGLTGVMKFLGSLAPTVSQWILGSSGLTVVLGLPCPCSVTMNQVFHQVSHCSNALLGSTVSQWPLGPKGHHGVKHVTFIPGVPEEQH